MSGWVFRVRWSRDEWGPCGIDLRQPIAVQIAVSDCRLWPPEVVGILRVPAGNARVVRGQIQQRKDPSCRRKVEITRSNDLTQDGVPYGSWRAAPEGRDLTLFGGSC